MPVASISDRVMAPLEYSIKPLKGIGGIPQSLIVPRASRYLYLRVVLPVVEEIESSCTQCCHHQHNQDNDPNLALSTLRPLPFLLPHLSCLRLPHLVILIVPLPCPHPGVVDVGLPHLLGPAIELPEILLGRGLDPQPNIPHPHIGWVLDALPVVEGVEVRGGCHPFGK